MQDKSLAGMLKFQESFRDCHVDPPIIREFLLADQRRCGGLACQVVVHQGLSARRAIDVITPLDVQYLVLWGTVGLFGSLALPPLITSHQHAAAFSYGATAGEGLSSFLIGCRFLLFLGSALGRSRGVFLGPQPGDPFSISCFPGLRLIRSQNGLYVANVLVV